MNNTYYFAGHFDGDNHLVTLYLNTSTLQYVGVFGYARNATIANLGSAGQIQQSSASSTAYVGGICGYAFSTTLSNCYNTGNVSSNRSTGGICGYCSNGSITNCHNTGNVSASIRAGGICGYLLSNSSVNAYLTNCHNTGNVSASRAGGICGNCQSTHSKSSYLINCHNTGNVSASNYAGGICGYSEGSDNNNVLIINCYNTGCVTTTSSSSYAGGIHGYSYFINTNNETSLVAVKIINCYNTGNVSSTTSTSSSYASGIFGYSPVSSTGTTLVTTNNCYNVGFLTGGRRYGISPMGSITNCHYLNTCGGTLGGGTAKTEAQMKSSSFPVILNTDSVVFVIDITPNINQGYPVFGNVTTFDAVNIANTTATLRGNYKMLYNVDTQGFEYKKSSESNYTIVNTTGEGPVLYNVSGLQGGTQYTYRFFVQKDGVIYRGADKTFNTIQCSLGGEIVASATALCSGDTLTYSINPTSSNASQYQYVWNTGATTNSIQITDDATYTVTVTDNYGCSIVRSKQMTLYPAAEAFITGGTVLCNNYNTTLTANGGTYYSWNTGSAQRIITVTQPGSYIVTVTTIYGCTASDTVEVISFTNPTISGNTTFCSGDYTILTATGGDTYLWSTGAITPSINVNTPGTYSVTASTSNGCSGSAAVMVIQNQVSEVAISGNTLICSGIGTALTATTGTSYLWSTGETTQTITANNPGTYTVTVTVANGCSNSASQTISLMEQTTISGNAHICSGQSTTLTANGSGSFLWSNNAATSFITVSTPGTYSVTVSLPNGCTSSATVNVTTASLPTPVIVGNTVFCQGQSSILTATGGNSYNWSNGSTSNNISVSQSGVYTVTATNIEGCSASTSVTVTVNPLPNVTIFGSNSFCQGNNTTLTASGANNYSWSNGQTTSSITVNTIGNYTVTGTDLNGCSNTASQLVTMNPTYNTPITQSICQGESYNFLGQNLTTAGTYTQILQTVNGCDSIITLTLTVKPLPTPVISGNTSICQGESTTLIATGGISYNWNNGSTANNINVNQSGVYTVTATNVEGCSASATVTVTVNSLPIITINGNTTICAGSSTTLTASGANSYMWSTGENTASVTINAFGVYSVTGTSLEGCTGTANVTVLVSQLPVITITGETDICAGESTILTAHGGDTYLWNNGSTESTLTVSIAGTYQVIGYNADGCSSIASADVHVWQPASSEFTIVTADSCYTWNGETYCTSGDYTQTLQTIHGCDSVVTLHLTITVGVEEYEKVSFKLYPNSTSKIVNVECEVNNAQWEDVEIQLFDLYGKLLQLIPVYSETIQVDLSQYAKGVYLMKLTNNGSVMAVQKIVKQ